VTEDLNPAIPTIKDTKGNEVVADRAVDEVYFVVEPNSGASFGIAERFMVNLF
jgi:hypothetical protein